MIPRAPDARRAAARPRRRPCLARNALATTFALLCGWAASHATVVFGTLAVAPNPPPPATPLVLELSLVDPTGAPVESAVVRAALTPIPSETGSEGAPVAEVRFRETSPGTYRAEASVPSAGEYRVLLRDRTYPEEEATQTVHVTVGGTQPVEPVEFLFPPTDSGTGLATWLLWLVALPLVAGILVTVLVVRGGSRDGAREPPESGA